MHGTGAEAEAQRRLGTEGRSAWESFPSYRTLSGQVGKGGFKVAAASHVTVVPSPRGNLGLIGQSRVPFSDGRTKGD